MMESVTLPDPQQHRQTGWLAGRELPSKSWALIGAKGRPAQFIRSLYMAPGELEKHNFRLAEKYALMQKNDARAEITGDSDPQVVLAAYGSSARLAKGALELLQARGVRAALFRPITLWPFPTDELANLATRVDRFVVVEMSLGQFIEDVQLSVAREKSLKQARVELLAHPGGGIPSPEEIVAKALEVLA
jgi:2-oxoglutarate ferredoxin oxidoreductase subunit alpha